MLATEVAPAGRRQLKLLQGLVGLQDRDVEGRQLFAVEVDADDPSLAADHPHLGDPRVAGELDLELVGHLPQLGRRGVLAPQGVGHHGHVVDGARFDHRRHGAVGHARPAAEAILVWTRTAAWSGSVPTRKRTTIRPPEGCEME